MTTICMICQIVSDQRVIGIRSTTTTPREDVSGPAGFNANHRIHVARARSIHTPFFPRSLTIREGALLQSFPLSYRWKRPGKKFVRAEAINAIGDAVPPLLGKIVALHLLAQV